MARYRIHQVNFYISDKEKNHLDKLLAERPEEKMPEKLRALIMSIEPKLKSTQTK